MFRAQLLTCSSFFFFCLKFYWDISHMPWALPFECESHALVFKYICKYIQLSPHSILEQSDPLFLCCIGLSVFVALQEFLDYSRHWFLVDFEHCNYHLPFGTSVIASVMSNVNVSKLVVLVWTDILDFVLSNQCISGLMALKFCFRSASLPPAFFSIL